MSLSDQYFFLLFADRRTNRHIDTRTEGKQYPALHSKSRADNDNHSYNNNDVHNIAVRGRCELPARSTLLRAYRTRQPAPDLVVAKDAVVKSRQRNIY